MMRLTWSLVTPAALAAALLTPSPRAAGSQAEDPTRQIHHSVLIAGEKVGSQTTLVHPDGSIDCVYTLSRGRLSLRRESRFVLGPEGVPVRLENGGTGELGEPVEERFVAEDGVATWSSGAEEGRRRLAGPAFYLGVHSPPAAGALLARALLGAPAGSLPLLPAGRARIEKVGERRVSGPGGKRRVVLYALWGLGFSPSFVWLEPDGTSFATIEGVFAVVRQGWEGAVETLADAQGEAQEALSSRWAKQLPHRPQGGSLAFEGVRLFDAQAARMLPGQTVVVRGDRIAAVGLEGEVAIPPGAQVIPGRGRALLPGLWDLHVHLSEVDGPLYLAAGVTGVRDMANNVEKVVDLRARWDAGEALGPRVALAGYLDGPGGPAGGNLVHVETPEEARAAVARYAELGYVQVKLYNSLAPELVPVIVQEARKRGLKVSGHLPRPMTVEDAVRAGFDEIQHLNAVFRSLLPPEPAPTSGGADLVARAKRIADLDLEAPEVQRLIDLLAERKVAVDPTLVVFEEAYATGPGGLGASWASVAHRLPPRVRRDLARGRPPVPEGSEEVLERAFRAFLALTGKLHAAGVLLVVGTDSLAGFALHRELELRVEAGIPAPEVLRRATLGAARAVGRGAELGSIEAGKLADLVLIDGDPGRRITDVRKVVLTVKGGVVFRAEELYPVVGVLP